MNIIKRRLRGCILDFILRVERERHEFIKNYLKCWACGAPVVVSGRPLAEREKEMGVKSGGIRYHGDFKFAECYDCFPEKKK